MGMITGASLMLALWACTGNDLVASSSSNKDVQQVEIVNNGVYDPVYVNVVNQSN